MTARRPASLRGVITWVLASLGVAVLAVATALVVFTAVLHQTTRELQSAVQSVDLTHDISRRLLLHERTQDPLQRAATVRALRADLTDMRPFVSSEEEGRLLADAKAALEAYLAAGRRGQHDPDSLEQAFVLVEQLRHLNVAQADEVASDAARWNRLADMAGVLVALVLVAGVVLAMVWIKSRALRPVLTIGGAMDRYAGGDRSARVPEEGPEEFRLIAARFNQLAEALERTEKGRLAFMAGVAHEIRNPLSVMVGTVDLLEREVSEDRPARRIALFKRQVMRIERLVNDLLDTTRAEAGELDLELGDCDLRRIAGEVVELYRPGAPAHALHLELPHAPVLVRADPARIEQVVGNLVSNAVKYSNGGSEVAIRVYSDGGEAVLEVVDQGVGIPASEQDAIFEPFRRGGTGKARTVGVGIGLAVSRRIVEAHGGRMELDSEPGRGSRFQVHLPLADRPALAGTGPS